VPPLPLISVDFGSRDQHSKVLYFVYKTARTLVRTVEADRKSVDFGSRDQRFWVLYLIYQIDFCSSVLWKLIETQSFAAVDTSTPGYCI